MMMIYVRCNESYFSKHQTALHLACIQGDEVIVGKLLDAAAFDDKADTYLKEVDVSNRTPLLHACLNGNMSVVTYLLEVGRAKYQLSVNFANVTGKNYNNSIFLVLSSVTVAASIVPWYGNRIEVRHVGV